MEIGTISFNHRTQDQLQEQVRNSPCILYFREPPKLKTACLELARAYELVQEFVKMVKNRTPDALDPWLSSVAGSKLRDLENFATGIERDKAAVVAALSMEWSNGQVEGQVNRLKMLKRQMYGRAKFDLLRRRILHRTDPRSVHQK